MEKDTKKKKSGLRKAMLPAFAMLLASVLSLTTMTYAWFTQGTEADVGEFQLDVAAGGGLEISTTGMDGSWKSTITSEEIQTIEAIQTFQASSKLTPVSTVGAISAEGKLSFYTAHIDDTSAHQITSVTEAEGGYLVFALYFRNGESSEKNISVDGTAFKHVTEKTDYAHLATRVAFVNSGWHVATSANSDQYTNGETGGNAKIYDTNSDNHTQEGLADFRANGVDTLIVNSEGVTHDNFQSGALKYYGVKGEYNNPDTKQPAFGRFTEQSEVTELVTPAVGTDTFFTLQPASITKITVYIWVEGQDVDCTNYISSHHLQASLKFSVKGA